MSGLNNNNNANVNLIDDNGSKMGLQHRHHRARPVRQKKRIDASIEEEEKDLQNPSNALASPTSMSTGGLGNTRLKITFTSLGTLGSTPQVCGRHRLIPDGLCGTNEVYKEDWAFEVRHRISRVDGQAPVTVIEWKIINRASNHLTVRVESPAEALVRQNQGRTICNHVVRQAFDDRATELEADADILKATGGSEIKIASLLSLAKTLRPKRCLIGLYFFGLLHEEVQTHMQTLLQISRQWSSGSST